MVSLVLEIKHLLCVIVPDKVSLVSLAFSLCPFSSWNYLLIAGECWHLCSSWEHITVNVISTLKTAPIPHKSVVGAFSAFLKGHTPPQPSTHDPSANLKKKLLTAALMIKEGVGWLVKNRWNWGPVTSCYIKCFNWDIIRFYRWCHFLR